MPSLYIVLERDLGVDPYVNGNFLSKNNGDLERLAKRLRVTPLMDFFSVSGEEWSSVTRDHGIESNTLAPEEKWFAAEEGLETVNALKKGLAGSKLPDVERIESELREFVRVLEHAKSHGIRWHLAVDY